MAIRIARLMVMTVTLRVVMIVMSNVEQWEWKVSSTLQDASDRTET